MSGDVRVVRLGSRRRAWGILGLVFAVATAAGLWRLWWPAPDPTALLQQALAESAAGRHASAEAILGRVNRLRAPTPADRMVRAEVASELGRVRDALGELAQVPAGDPAGPMARFRAGRIEVKLGLLRAAEGHFLAALKGAPDAIQPRRELAYLYALQHRMDDLDRQFEALSDLGGLDEKTLVVWSRIHSANWNPKGDMDALANAVAADPTDDRSRLTLAEAYLRGNQPGESERVIAPLPDSDPEARALRVSIALARGDQAKAESLLAGGPHDHPALARFRGAQALARRDAAEAARHFRLALAAEPRDRTALFGLGTALKMSGEPAEAEPYLEAARRHDRLGTLVEQVVRKGSLDDPMMPARMGEACEAAGRLGEARAWYRLAISRDPLDEASQRAIYRLGHPTEARRTPSVTPPGD